MRFYNTRTKTQEKLTTINPKKVGMYVCGPTVYASPHIGNARSVVVYDLLFRLLRADKNFDDVTYARNITDVDDKINKAAKERGITIQQLTAEVTKDFHEVMSALGCLQPTVEPRATEHISEMINITQKLIANGHAYVAEGHVLFDVATDANYGKLSGRSQDEMIAGARVEVAPYKRNPSDFVLWKPADEEDDESAKFDSPWGKGRPGWHIECTAMSTKYLGENFDIHGGGLDLTFPHHENEVAQACCAFKGSHYANFWIHNGFLTVNGEKMSKSLGNFITVRDLLDKGVNGEVIRWALLSTHYRAPLDWSDKLLSDSKKAVDSFYRIQGSFDINPVKIPGAIMQSLGNDLNMPEVMAEIHQRLSAYNTPSLEEDIREDGRLELISILKLLGFLNQTADEYFGRGGDDTEIESLIEKRKQLKVAKDYREADLIRDQLLTRGVVIEDMKDGSTNWMRKQGSDW